MSQPTPSIPGRLDKTRRQLRTRSTKDLRNIVFAACIGIAIGAVSLFSPWLGLAAVVGVMIALASLSRPVILAYVMIAATVLASGMPRDELVPLLRPNEAVLALSFGLIIPTLLFAPRRARSSLRLVDLAMALYVLGVTILPAMVYLLRGLAFTTEDVMILVAPVQYVMLYVIFKYALASEQERRNIAYAMLIGGSVVAILGLLQAAEVPFVVNFLRTWYPSSHLRQAEEYGRVTSIVAGWNVFGILMMICLLLVRSLYMTGIRHSRMGRIIIWTSAGLCAAALLASGSFAGIIGLGIGLLVIGRFDGQNIQRILLIGVLLVFAGFLLQPILADRLAFQYREGNSIIPQTLLYRFELWEAIFIPAIRKYGLLGLQPDFAEAFEWGYAESQYFYLLLRSGLISLLGHLAWMGLLLVWLYRRVRASEGFSRGMALAAFSLLVVLAIAGLTNSVFSFSGAVDYLWILLGIVASQERLA